MGFKIIMVRTSLSLKSPKSVSSSSSSSFFLFTIITVQEITNEFVWTGPRDHTGSLSNCAHYRRDSAFPGWVRQLACPRRCGGSLARHAPSMQSGREEGGSTLDLEMSFLSSPTIVRRCLARTRSTEASPFCLCIRQ